MTPDPKPKRIKLKRNSIAWITLVDELYELKNYHCQGCGKYLFRNQVNPHHIITYGAGGEDVISNLGLLCSSCHVKIDSGELIYVDGEFVFRKLKNNPGSLGA